MLIFFCSCWAYYKFSWPLSGVPLTSSECISPYSQPTSPACIMWQSTNVTFASLQFKTWLTPIRMQRKTWRSRWTPPQCIPQLYSLPPPPETPEWVWQMLGWKQTYPGLPTKGVLSDQTVIDDKVKENVKEQRTLDLHIHDPQYSSKGNTV